MQELIRKAELSDTIFEALTNAYNETVKFGLTGAYQKEYLREEAELSIQDGEIPNTVTPTEAVTEFFNRL